MGELTPVSPAAAEKIFSFLYCTETIIALPAKHHATIITSIHNKTKGR
jgi:hypothetical protein